MSKRPASSQGVAPRELRPSPDDEYMERLAKKFFNALSLEKQESLTRSFKAFSGGMPFGSVISGSEIQHLAGKALFHVLRRADESLGPEEAPYKIAYGCDTDKLRQRWFKDYIAKILSWAPWGEADLPCCFEDPSDMLRARSSCIVHGRNCRVKRCFIVFGAVSCKDISACKNAGSQRKSELGGGDGATVKSFQSLLAFLEHHRCPLYIGENIGELAEAGSSNNLSLQERFMEIDYVVGMRVFRGSSFGSPTRRERAVIVAMNSEVLGVGKQDALKIIEDIFATMQSISFEGKSPTEFMLPSTHEYVLQRLEQLQAGVSRTSDGAGWREQYDKLLRSQGLRYSECVAPPDQRASPWFAALPERARVNLGYVLSTRPGCTSADLGQSVGRAFVSENPNEYPTMLPKHMIWDVELKRLVLGYESMRMIGFDDIDLPIKDLEAANITDTQLKELAGTSFTGQIVMALLLSTLANLPPLCQAIIDHYALDCEPESEVEDDKDSMPSVLLDTIDRMLA